MIEAKHTPGPYFLEDGWLDGHVSISSESHGAIAQVLVDMDRESYYTEFLRDKKIVELNANAALFATAPEMLETLQDLVGWLEQGDVDASFIDPIKALILKALGED